MGMKPIKGLNITLVTPDPELVYTGMLPAAILGAYSFDQIKIDLIKLSKFAKCRIVFSYVNKINLDRKEIHLGERTPIEFDMLSLDIGINYQLNKNLYHNIGLEYVLKDYSITNSASVSNSILNSSGENMSYLIKNNFR